MTRDEEEVLVELRIRAEGCVCFVDREERELARVDPAGALNDQRARRLPVDRGEMNARDDAAVDEIGEHASGADRRQLVRVADEQDVTVARRAEERIGELEREHRRLVDDDQVVVVRKRPSPRRDGSPRVGE